MSKLQKWSPNYTQVSWGSSPWTSCEHLSSSLYLSLHPCQNRWMSLHGAVGYAPGLSAPRCPTSVLAPNILGEIPSANAKVLVCLPSCLLQGRGGQKLRGIKRLFARRSKPRLPLPLPTENPDKISGNGGTVTHSLQVLHSLQWHPPSKGERAPCSSPHPGLPHLHSHATWGCP